jgi:thioredoxin 1
MIPSRQLTALLIGLVTASGITTMKPAAQAPASAVRQIYPTSDARKSIDAAFVAAARDGKHVLLDFGADWCPDCRVLDTLFDDPAVAAVAASSFHIVRVDVGRRDKNDDLVAAYASTSGDWIPALVVLDPGKNRIAITDDKVRVTRRTTPAELRALLEQWSPKRLVRDLGGFTERGVRVRVSLQENPSRRTWLTATFTPTTSETHLYGKDLPRQGINGLGRPTRLAVVAGTGVTVTGDPVADRIVRDDRLEALNTTLSVYPPGPVSLHLPVRLVQTGRPARAELSISYMACGTNGCLPPVSDRRFVVSF